MAVAVVATFLALPMAFVIGRGRGWCAKLLQAATPTLLFMPFLSFEYGWLQCIRLLQPVYRPLGLSIEPGGLPDIIRCIWILAAWLWVVPAYVVGLSLQQLDPAIQECALLDGVAIRMTLRQLWGPIVAAVAVVTILATQEFAVYEPTGVNVVATEVRMVFSTGAFSSLPDLSHQGQPAPLTQSERAAACMATAAPLLLATLLLAGLGVGTARRLWVQENLHVGGWSPRLDAPRWILWLAFVVLIVCVGCPVFSLCASMRSMPPGRHLLSETRAAGMGLTPDWQRGCAGRTHGCRFSIVGLAALAAARSRPLVPDRRRDSGYLANPRLQPAIFGMGTRFVRSSQCRLFGPLRLDCFGGGGQHLVPRMAGTTTRRGFGRRGTGANRGMSSCRWPGRCCSPRAY